MASEDTNTVDATPISPVRSNERRGSLEKHLQHRPEAQDLKNRHILLDTTTAPYVSWPLASYIKTISLPSLHLWHVPSADLVSGLSKPKLLSSNASVRPTTLRKASTRVPSAMTSSSEISSHPRTLRLPCRRSRGNLSYT
jgi:hypothetical protein